MLISYTCYSLIMTSDITSFCLKSKIFNVPTGYLYVANLFGYNIIPLIKLNFVYPDSVISGCLVLLKVAVLLICHGPWYRISWSITFLQSKYFDIIHDFLFCVCENEILGDLIFFLHNLIWKWKHRQNVSLPLQSRVTSEDHWISK